MYEKIRDNPIEGVLAGKPAFSKRVRELLCRMLQFEKGQRIGWDQIFYHPLLKTQIYDSVYASLKSVTLSIGKWESAASSESGGDRQRNVDIEDIDDDKEEEISVAFKKKQDEDRKRINKSNVKEAIKYERQVSKFLFQTALMFYQDGIKHGAMQ